MHVKGGRLTSTRNQIASALRQLTRSTHSDQVLTVFKLHRRNTKPSSTLLYVATTAAVMEKELGGTRVRSLPELITVSEEEFNNFSLYEKQSTLINQEMDRMGFGR